MSVDVSNSCDDDDNIPLASSVPKDCKPAETKNTKRKKHVVCIIYLLAFYANSVVTHYQSVFNYSRLSPGMIWLLLRRTRHLTKELYGTILRSFYGTNQKTSVFWTHVYKAYNRNIKRANKTRRQDPD